MVHRLGNRRLWRRLARAPEAVAGCLEGRPRPGSAELPGAARRTPTEEAQEPSWGAAEGGAGRCDHAASQPRGCRSGPLQMGRSPGSLSDSGEESEPPPPERKGASAECDVGEVGRGMDARRSASGDIGVASRLCEARGAGACVAERDLPGALPAGLGVGGLGGRWLEASAAHAVSQRPPRPPTLSARGTPQRTPQRLEGRTLRLCSRGRPRGLGLGPRGLEA